MNFKLFAVKQQSYHLDIIFLILRLVTGVAFILHGWGKIQAPMSWMGPESPVPGILQALGAIAEFGGGIALILGLLTRLAGFGLACTMVVAALLHAVVLKDPFVAGKGGGGSYELATLYLVISIMFMVQGPGRFSIDQKIFKEQ